MLVATPLLFTLQQRLSEMKVRAPDGDWHLNLIKLQIHLTILPLLRDGSKVISHNTRESLKHFPRLNKQDMGPGIISNH